MLGAARQARQIEEHLNHHDSWTVVGTSKTMTMSTSAGPELWLTLDAA